MDLSQRVEQNKNKVITKNLNNKIQTKLLSLQGNANQTFDGLGNENRWTHKCRASPATIGALQSRRTDPV